MRSINTYYTDFESLKMFVSKNSDSIFESNPSAVFVQIFSCNDSWQYLSNVTSEITSLIPHACIIGATAGSVIMNGEVSGQDTILSFSLFYHSKVRSLLLQKEGQSDYNLGVSLASQLNSNTAKVMIIFAASQRITVNELLVGIQSVNSSLPIVGGNAGDACHSKPAVLFCNGQMTESGVLGAVLEGDNLVANRFWHLGWQPIGKAMIVTKAEGLRIYTIDHLPAFEVYKKYLGINNAEAFSTAVEYPLLVDRNEIQLARVPVVCHEDGSITFAGDLREGEIVRLSFGNISLILDSVKNLCTKIILQPAESLFVYSCICRRGYLQDLCKLETEPLQLIAPTAGFFTSGEFFHSQNSNHLFNATMTVLSLYEEDNMRSVEFTREGTDGKELQVIDGVRKDFITEKNVGVLRALSHLINTVTNELEQAQADLRYNVIGEMAASIGHEVRNPMTTVRGYLQMFQNKSEFSSCASQLSTMIEELDRANLIITEFLSLSKRKRVEMKNGNLNNVLKSLFPLFQADAIKRGHEIYLEAGNIPDCKFDVNEIRQIIINLVRNGLEAMHSPGKLNISTQLSDKEVILSISDTGTGIPLGIRDKLGTPFITTKDEGTGLGLSVCYRIAERHQAKIEITTGETGTTVAVIFKAIDEAS